MKDVEEDEHAAGKQKTSLEQVEPGELPAGAVGEPPVDEMAAVNSTAGMLSPKENMLDELVALEMEQEEVQEFVPFASRLEQAVRDPSIMQRMVANLGGSSAHTVEGLQAALVQLHQQRTSPGGNLSLLQKKGNGKEAAAKKATETDVSYDDLLSGMAEASGTLAAAYINGETIDEKTILQSTAANSDCCWYNGRPHSRFDCYVWRRIFGWHSGWRRPRSWRSHGEGLGEASG